MIKNNLVSKIEQLKKEILDNNNMQYHYLIIQLLNDGVLNELICNITDTKTKLNINTLIKKDYLSGNEQFLSLLSNFIYRFKEDFYFLQKNFEVIIKILLQNEKDNKYLLCKRYIGNNKFVEYFSYNYKKLIVAGFYNNLKVFYKSSELVKKFIEDNKIILKKSLNFNINYLYDALIKISISNTKEINCILLFEDINVYIKKVNERYKKNKTFMLDSIFKHYLTEWENMINNYYDKIESINNLLK